MDLSFLKVSILPHDRRLFYTNYSLFMVFLCVVDSAGMGKEGSVATSTSKG